MTSFEPITTDLTYHYAYPFMLKFKHTGEKFSNLAKVNDLRVFFMNEKYLSQAKAILNNAVNSMEFTEQEWDKLRATLEFDDNYVYKNYMGTPLHTKVKKS